jgi:phenylacetate-CoA ligase
MSKFDGALRTGLYMPLAERFAGRKIQERVAYLEEWKRVFLIEKQKKYEDALTNVLLYASVHVPYYRDLFRRIKFDPEKLRLDLAWINDVPHLTKEIVMMQPDRFISDEFEHRALIERKTSGSTGLTLSFFYSQSELDLASAVLRYLDRAAGKSLGEKEVYLRLVSPDEKISSLRNRLEDKFKDYVLNRHTIEINELSTYEAKRCLNLMCIRRPYSVYALRSTFESLLRLSEESGLCRDICKSYISTGETLERRSAEFIASAVGCDVFNRYGNAEFGAVAQSKTDTQSLHFVDGLVWPENFTVEGKPEIVLTTLPGRAMPLIRYRTGDLGNVCPDGQGGFILNNVMGRLHDLVHVGERSYTSAYFSDFFQRHFAVHDFQVVEGSGENSLEFRVVTDRPEEIELMSSALEQLLGQDVRVVRIRLSDLIRRGRQMKFSHVIRGASS